MDDYYKTLGVDKSADEEVIYAAYKALAKKYHPDKGLQDEDKIKIINIAFDILSNKEKRNEYDKKIGYVEKNDNSYLNDGDYKYEGEYKDGKYHGQGTLTYPDGDKYVGEHKDGEHHGQGTYTYSDGSKYEGNWKEGVKQGQGKMTWGDGESNTYEGEYRDGKWHGKGKYVVDLGGKEETICEGIWEEGKFIKGKKITSDYMYYEGVFNNYILIKGKQVIEHPEGSSIQEGEFNLDGSDKIDFIYTEFSSILDEDECYVGTFKDNGWNDGFIIKVNTGKKIRKVENGTVYKLGFFDKF